MDGNSGKIYTAEIAICLEEMDRTVSRMYKFRIPALNLDMDQDEETEKIIHLSNDDIVNKTAPDVNNIKISNYVSIYVPLEVMGVTTDGEHEFKGKGRAKGTMNSSGSFTVKGVNASIKSSSVNGANISSVMTNSFNGMGDVNFGSGSINIISKNTTLSGTNLQVNNYETEREFEDKSYVTIITERYIPVGSKWIVMFIGGDPAYPRIIARYN